MNTKFYLSNFWSRRCKVSTQFLFSGEQYQWGPVWGGHLLYILSHCPNLYAIKQSDVHASVKNQAIMTVFNWQQLYTVQQKVLIQYVATHNYLIRPFFLFVEFRKLQPGLTALSCQRNNCAWNGREDLGRCGIYFTVAGHLSWRCVHFINFEKIMCHSMQVFLTTSTFADKMDC